MKGKIEAVTLLDTIDSDFHHIKVQIDFDDYHMFDNYNKIVKLINEYVSYKWRHDIISGNKEKVICELALYRIIQTVDKTTGIKLMPSGSSNDACCNIRVKDIKFGDIQYGCIFLLSKFQYGSSDKAAWYDLEVIDKESHSAPIRFFIDRSKQSKADSSEDLTNAVGRYIRCDVTLTRYGYQTSDICIYDVPVVTPKEVDIAASILYEVLSTDKELADYVSTYNLVEHLRTVVSGVIGYHLVYMAMEIMLINTLGDMSYDFDLKVLKRAVFCSRGYLLQTKTQFSKSMLNVTKVLKTKLATDRELMLILDILAVEDISCNKWAYLEITRFVSSLIDIRRGVLDLSYLTDTFENVRKLFNNLI